MAWIRTDKETGQKEQISEAKVRQMMEGNYRDVAQAMRDMKAGIELPTTFFIYKWET